MKQSFSFAFKGGKDKSKKYKKKIEELEDEIDKLKQENFKSDQEVSTLKKNRNKLCKSDGCLTLV